jgi:hypothetical protein
MGKTRIFGIIGVITTLSIIVISLGCGSSSGGGSGTVSTWSIHEEYSGCGWDGETDDYAIKMTQDGSSVSLSDEDGVFMVGTISGNTLTLHDPEITSATVTMTLSNNGTTMQGTSQFEDEDDYGNPCTVELQVTGTKQ